MGRSGNCSRLPVLWVLPFSISNYTLYMYSNKFTCVCDNVISRILIVQKETVTFVFFKFRRTKVLQLHSQIQAKRYVILSYENEVKCHKISYLIKQFYFN